jgi:hypothetical protein
MLLWNVVPVLWRKLMHHRENGKIASKLRWWERTLPQMAIFVVLAWIPWIANSFQSKPTPPAQGYFGFNPLPPPAPHTKQAINELLNESGKFSDLVTKTGLQLATEWQTLTNKNPERNCLDLDSHSFRNEIDSLALKFRDASITLDAIYDQNRIDQQEFNLIFPTPIDLVSPTAFLAWETIAAESPS